MVAKINNMSVTLQNILGSFRVLFLLFLFLWLFIAVVCKNFHLRVGANFYVAVTCYYLVTTKSYGRCIAFVRVYVCWCMRMCSVCVPVHQTSSVFQACLSVTHIIIMLIKDFFLIKSFMPYVRD